MLVVQSDAFNRSRLQATLVVSVTSNLGLVEASGDVLLPAKASGPPKESVANVTQLLALDDDFLTEPTGKLPPRLMAQIDAGLKLVLAVP